jgi:hypothetical protein
MLIGFEVPITRRSKVLMAEPKKVKICDVLDEVESGTRRESREPIGVLNSFRRCNESQFSLSWYSGASTKERLVANF